MRKLNVAVLGATGAVGQRFIQLLENHPWFNVAEVVASDRSAGKPYREACRWVLAGRPPADVAEVEALTLDAPLRSPLAVSPLPLELPNTLNPPMAAAGPVDSSNTNSHPMA